MNRFVINEDQIATLTKIIGNDRVTTILRAHPYNPQAGRDKVLDEVLQLPQRREQPNGSMYIYVNDVKALRQAGSP